MPEFLKNLMHRGPLAEPEHQPVGKRNVTGKIWIAHGKGFKVVREDILQKGLTHKKPKQAA